MPRGSSGGRSGGFGGRPSGGGRSFSTSRSPGYSSNYGSRTSRPSSTSRSPYASSTPYTTQAQSRGPLGGMGLGSALATGAAIGGGSALGHHLVGGMFGGHGHSMQGYQQNVPQGTSGNIGSPVTQEQALQENIKTNPCFEFNTKFVECLQGNKLDISKCQIVFDDLISCEKSLI